MKKIYFIGIAGSAIAPLAILMKNKGFEVSGSDDNVFEPALLKLHPEISDLKESLYKAGAVYASMTGSGSSVFGIFKDRINWTGSLGKAHIWTEYI